MHLKLPDAFIDELDACFDIEPIPQISPACGGVSAMPFRTAEPCAQGYAARFCVQEVLRKVDGALVKYGELTPVHIHFSRPLRCLEPGDILTMVLHK